tara:strand:- start:65841 stop:68423 length:2583 start_codon:yes stop_codon:yes gene_type:complete
MRLHTQHINTLVLLFLLLTFSSCSTKKKAWTNRQYHNTTAKFNGYFNGEQSIRSGIRKLHSGNEDDFTTIIRVFPTGDLKKTKKIHPYMDRAIKKGSIVIQRHSIKIKGKEYCKWIDDNYLLVGKGYFYKGDFDEAIKTFVFIKNEYSKNEIRFEAALWLLRSYVEKKDFISAKLELEELIKNKRFPDKLNKNLSLIASDYYLQKGNLQEAISELKNATELIKRKRKKVRLNYILAQLYQQSNNYVLAQKYYQLVLKSSPEYEMAFNAKMNLARSLEQGNSNTRKMREKLLKMTKDDKNKEYLDQIYFTIAEMDINSKDTSSAIQHYNLSTVNSVENNPQKALSFLSLAKINFNKGLYEPAKTNYDSTIFYMDEDFRLYNKAKERHNILLALIENIKTVELEDSLQTLGKLPRAEQNIIVSKIIQREMEKERIAAEEERLRKQMAYESGINRGRDDRFGSKTSGGKWYFYNPATLSFGMSEFRKKWGKRKLEDDWRRRDKKTAISFEADSIINDSIAAETKNKKDPNYYLNQLPKSDEDYKKSDSRIKEALYQLGVIYRESLNEINKSNYSFLSIYSRFPKDPQYAPLSLYNIHSNYLELQNKEKVEKTKKSLLESYPNSIYAKMVLDSDYSLELLNKKDNDEAAYKLIFSLYTDNKFDEVLIKTTNILEGKQKSRQLFLRALSMIKLKEERNAIKILETLAEGGDEISAEAKYILEAIKFPSKMEKANELALTGSSYLYRTNSQHMVVVVVPKKGVDVTYLKTLISDFHNNTIGNEVFEISALLLGIDQHLLMIKSFDNINESMKYYNLFVEENTVMEMLAKSEHKVMSISLENFKEFYRNKDVNGYHSFFIKNYLTTE